MVILTVRNMFLRTTKPKKQKQIDLMILFQRKLNVFLFLQSYLCKLDVREYSNFLSNRMVIFFKYRTSRNVGNQKLVAAFSLSWTPSQTGGGELVGGGVIETKLDPSDQRVWSRRQISNGHLPRREMSSFALNWPSTQVVSYLDRMFLRRVHLNLLDCLTFYGLGYSGNKLVFSNGLGASLRMAEHWQFNVSLLDSGHRVTADYISATGISGVIFGNKQWENLKDR